MSLEIGRLTRLQLGRVGENKARRIEIDVSEWLAEWPGATVGLLMMRPGEDNFYPVAARVEEGVLKYTILRSDVENEGDGLAQIVLVGEGDVELRSRVVPTKVEGSLPGSESAAPEEPMQPFVDQVLDAAERAVKAAKDAEEHKLDGFSPIAKVESTAAGAVVTITDKSGTTSVTLTEGVDGKDGEDGVSPVVSVSKSGGVTTLTIVDATGTKTAKINDGAAGADGKDGYTPIKNIDYFDGKDGSAGKDGDPGDPGVYVGESEPTDPDVKVWVDPNGETHLPIASADTLGGVKVGEGLRMDGDVLGVVPEPEYELIETIVCDGTYGNIARMNLSLKRVVLYINTKAAEAVASVGVEIKNGELMFGYTWIASCINTSERWTYVKAVSEGKGWAYLEGCSAATSNYSSATLSRTVSRFNGITPITRVGMYVAGGGLFPEGSTIEIWGVPANA